ncbi:MAG: hypothetical protein QF570_12140 [Myxococcota bacterium]|jgi:hypothetical protein|nr:hypothetical protein [Myxococcota bacterium]
MTPPTNTGKKAEASQSGVARGEARPLGRVTHYYPHANAAVVSLEVGALRVGDVIHVHGHTTDFVQAVASIQQDGQAVDRVEAPGSVGIGFDCAVREGDRVDRVADRES